ncbi:EGF domain-specific O-linked N-acetylglucosamine transferase-like [Sycon ciliatum]|uniref:EGF domain-specific O-linked N-acetylglucosamine transferase-like n=1 Tax=Sycon ciliatum TaxID=27933 RepID=UPI0031F67287
METVDIYFTWAVRGHHACFLIGVILLVLLGGAEAGVESVDNSDLAHLDVGLTDFLRYKADRARCGSDEPCTLPPEGKCWGYEKNCAETKQLSMPECTGSPAPHASTMEGKIQKFHEQAGFAYAKQFSSSMETVCESQSDGDSSLTCSKDLAHCRATNLYIDFREADFKKRPEERLATARLRPDFIGKKMLGGKCRLTKSKLGQPKYSSHLQSWWAELHNFHVMDEQTNTKNKHCDVVVQTPVIFMKMDAKVNLYHHFCDFVNLYVSQHINGSFSRDVQIIDWDTSDYPNNDLFEQTWDAFTKRKVKRLTDYGGKRVCFNEVLFPLLPRMVFGLFYNMPVVPDCSGSSLMESFSHFLLNRLAVQRWHTKTELEARRVRVTFLSRGTRYRNVLNEEEILGTLKTVGRFSVRRVRYDRDMTFREQIESSHNSDILIGMHGAGLTHMLFLPEWAGVFEIYNTEDPNCYKDLAAIRGLYYQTWEKKKLLFPQDGGHHKVDSAKPKFTDYRFDAKEFLRLVEKLADRVQQKRDKLRPKAKQPPPPDAIKTEL